MESVELLKSLLYFDYLKTKWWAFIRQERLALDKYKCKKCNQKNELEVHHLSYENLGEENVYTDLITLCARCHNDTHYFKELIRVTMKMVLQQSVITEQEFEKARTTLPAGKPNLNTDGN